MSGALPPVQAQDWAAHQDDAYQTLTKDHSSQIDTAIQAQSSLDQETAARDQQLDQSWQQTTQQHASALDAAIQGQQQSADQSWQQTTDQHAAALDAAIQAQSGLSATPSTRDQYASQPTAPRAPAGAGVEQHRGAIEAAFGDLGPAVVDNMLAVMERESGGDANAQKTDSVEDSHGPLQINARAHPDLAQKYDLHDPAQNAQAAREIYDSQGYGAWYNASKQLGLLEGRNATPSGADRQAYSYAAGEGDALGADVPAPGGRNADIAPQTPAGAGTRVEAVGQLEQGLSAEDAYSICGPVAALAFAQANGRNPDLGEARRLAKQVGWTSQGGMNGVANEAKLLEQMGVSAKLDPNPDFGHIAEDAASGNPVIISTPVHYYFINGYDRQTGQLHVGKTGEARKGGGSWMSAQQISDLDGGINGALFVDNPQSPTPSVGVQAPPQSEPPLDDQEPQAADLSSQYQRGGVVGGSFADDQATVRVPGTGLDQPASPDLLGAARTAADAGGDFLVGRMEESNRQNELLRQESLRQTEKMQRGEPVTEEDRAKLLELIEPIAMSLTPEPLANAGARIAGKIAGPVVEGLLDAAGKPIRTIAGDVTSILGPAGEVLKDVKVRVPKVDIPHPEFLQPEAKMPAQAVGLGRQVFDRTRNVIGSMGDAGQELANRVHAWREGAEVDAQGFIDRMPTVEKLGKTDFVNLVDVLEGNAKPVSMQVAKAAEEAKGVLDDVFSRAQNAQVDVAERIGNYFPHVYKEDIVSRLRDTGKRAAAIRHLMTTGQADTEAEAIDKLSRFSTASGNRRNGSLEMERLANLPGYEKTKEALYNHILSASRRLNEVAQFGRDDAIKDHLVTRMTAEGYQGDLANDMFKTIVGANTYSDAAKKISAIGRTFHTATRLGLSAISNATQSVNTASVAGVLNTLQAMPKAAWSAEEKAFARSTGVTLDAVIKEVREGAGWSDKIPGLLLPGFNQVETFNRRVAAIAGRDFAAEMAQKAAAGSSSAARALEKLGLDAAAVAKRGTLTAAEEVAAARNIVERTQFRVDPQDLPQWTSHPIGKMVAQFKTFSYNQSAFVKRELLDEARKGNVLPLVRFAILAPLAQAAATETRNKLSGRDPEEDPGMRALQYALGPLGVVGDVSRTLFGINSKYVPPERRASQFVGSLLGPTVGTLTEAGAAGLSAADIVLHPDESKIGARLTPALRLALRQVPVAGSYLANTITPYKSAAPATSSGGRSTTGPPRPPAPPRPPSPPKAPKR